MSAMDMERMFQIAIIHSKENTGVYSSLPMMMDLLVTSSPDPMAPGSNMNSAVMVTIYASCLRKWAL